MQSPSSQPPPRYGAPISVDAAKRVMMLHRMDQTQMGSLSIAQFKAETAVNFKRPTRIFEDTIAAGGFGLRFLSVSNTCAPEGGLPLFVDGAIVGAIGVSGMHSTQDAQVAAAGAAAL